MSIIIDSHLHSFLKEGHEQEMLANMDAAGVERSILLPMPPVEFRGACCMGNKECFEMAQRHPNRFAPGVYADPRDSNATGEVKKYAQLGAVVVKLFPPVGFYPDDPLCMNLYETIAKLRIPVLSHTGATSMTYWQGKPRASLCTHWADPIRFDGLSRKFPEITWILAHMGMPWCHNAWYVASVNSNVYLDIAGGRVWLAPLPSLRESLGESFEIDFDRVIWGSDNCLPPVEHIAFTKELLNKLNCDESYHVAIFGQTAKNLFGL